MNRDVRQGNGGTRRWQYQRNRNRRVKLRLLFGCKARRALGTSEQPGEPLGIAIRVIQTGVVLRSSLVRREVMVDDARMVPVGEVRGVHVLLRQEQHASDSQRKQAAERRFGCARHGGIMAAPTPAVKSRPVNYDLLMDEA